jgi:hypothetical protein
LRIFFPKKTDFSLISEEDIKYATNRINKFSRKKFNYRSANMIYDYNEKIANTIVFAIPKININHLNLKSDNII